MGPTERCDEILRLIDDVLAGDRPALAAHSHRSPEHGHADATGSSGVSECSDTSLRLRRPAQWVHARRG